MGKIEDRAAGALTGLAIGDALGMPTQSLPRSEVRRLFPELAWFEAGPAENRISAGWPAGKVTDDTEQALILAGLLTEGGGHPDPRRFVDALLAWSREAEQDGSEQLGPSTRRALLAVAAGTPVEEAGRAGSTNGASMRIAPVGVAVGVGDLTTLVDRVEEACLATHHTGQAIAGAAAVAAAVSAGLEGMSFAETVSLACQAADLGIRRGYYVAGPDVTRRIKWAIGLVDGVDDYAADDLIAGLVGTGVATEQSVPAAFALVSRSPEDPWRVCLAAAQIGGDTDTIAAIAGAISGARAGAEAFPHGAVPFIEEVNDLDLRGVARQLLALRVPATAAP